MFIIMCKHDNISTCVKSLNTREFQALDNIYINGLFS